MCERRNFSFACRRASLRGKPFLLEVRDLWPEFGISMGVLKNPLIIALASGQDPASVPLLAELAEAAQSGSS